MRYLIAHKTIAPPPNGRQAYLKWGAEDLLRLFLLFVQWICHGQVMKTHNIRNDCKRIYMLTIQYFVFSVGKWRKSFVGTNHVNITIFIVIFTFVTDTHHPLICHTLNHILNFILAFGFILFHNSLLSLTLWLCIS